MYRIFVDEVGHEDFTDCELSDRRYLGLTGVIMDQAYEQGEFTKRLNELKLKVFGDEKLVLHRREIMNRCPSPFDRLKDEKARSVFNTACLQLLADSKYCLLTVVIDKAEHLNTYKVWRFHPYHYCMTCLLERYSLWLGRRGFTGDVMFESRGKKQNKRLSKSYRRLFLRGTDEIKGEIFQKRFTSVELKIQEKAANIAGLQLADLIASPLCRDLICRNLKEDMKAEFGRQIVEIARKAKYDRHWNGRIEGWGTKWLPK